MRYLRIGLISFSAWYDSIMQTITCRWTKEDVTIWCTAQFQSAAYRSYCASQLVYCVAFGAVMALVFGLRNLSSWFELSLWMLASGLVAFLIGKACQAGYTRRSLAAQIRQDTQNLSSESYTLVLEPRHLKLLLKDSEHTYQWSSVELIENPPNGFLGLRIQEQDLYIPPSVFTEIALREAFWKQLVQYKKDAGDRTEPSSWWKKQAG
jgi:hypothetical protein